MKLMMVLMQPAGPLLQGLMERSCELAPVLPHVQAAEVIRDEVLPTGERQVVQLWRAQVEVPVLLQPHLDPGLLEWSLTLRQPAGGSLIRFHAASRAVQVPGRCEGTFRFTPAAGGRGTRIEMELEFPNTSESLRRIFGELVARHWRALLEGVATRLSGPAG
ncbi:hypothetical protein H5407_05755 [Mitsuaria sp. WAJ17]|uniref:hypothetical protein n=1 Tax=Mitsuaria sp. WAJ17 TaxID=2761452 RepID=UPI0015FF0412|nr:hypothetical protein [Mitsuaria sp. WAJ17]MBB2484728.1 hypothetical protein [Mitsuaria sp. WAJ17]